MNWTYDDWFEGVVLFCCVLHADTDTHAYSYMQSLKKK